MNEKLRISWRGYVELLEVQERCDHWFVFTIYVLNPDCMSAIYVYHHQSEVLLSLHVLVAAMLDFSLPVQSYNIEFGLFELANSENR